MVRNLCTRWRASRCKAYANRVYAKSGRLGKVRRTAAKVMLRGDVGQTRDLTEARLQTERAGGSDQDRTRGWHLVVPVA
ncbi:protein of unknown function [Pararobbsia alpina]